MDASRGEAQAGQGVSQLSRASLPSRPQLSQDSPEQEASKSPRGGVPGGGEASLPPEGNPQGPLQSPASVAAYSQVGRGAGGAAVALGAGCVGWSFCRMLGRWMGKKGKEKEGELGEKGER